MRLETLSQDQLRERCAWCHRVISDDEAIFGGGAKVKPSAKNLLLPHIGKFIPFPMSDGREVIAIVPGEDSEAAAAGHDLYFQTCSEECAERLSQAMRRDLDVGGET